MRLTRTLPSLAAIVVGLASFALSYVALRDVSVRVGAVPADPGWLVPIVVDAGAVSGSAVIWAASQEDEGRQQAAGAMLKTCGSVSGRQREGRTFPNDPVMVIE